VGAKRGQGVGARVLVGLRNVSPFPALPYSHDGLNVRRVNVRSYLPEEVVHKIDKMRGWGERAALILTMLMFLLNHVPLVAIPPQCLTAVEILKGLIISARYLCKPDHTLAVKRSTNHVCCSPIHWMVVVDLEEARSR
jgi:hypothetical protein